MTRYSDARGQVGSFGKCRASAGTDDDTTTHTFEATFLYIVVRTREHVEGV